MRLRSSRRRLRDRPWQVSTGRISADPESSPTVIPQKADSGGALSPRVARHSFSSSLLNSLSERSPSGGASTSTSTPKSKRSTVCRSGTTHQDANSSRKAVFVDPSIDGEFVSSVKRKVFSLLLRIEVGPIVLRGNTANVVCAEHLDLFARLDEQLQEPIRLRATGAWGIFPRRLPCNRSPFASATCRRATSRSTTSVR